MSNRKAAQAVHDTTVRIADDVMLATAALPAWMTLPEVAEFTRRSRTFVLELIASRELAAVQNKRGRKGSRLLISTESLRR